MIKVRRKRRKLNIITGLLVLLIVLGVLIFRDNIKDSIEVGKEDEGKAEINQVDKVEEMTQIRQEGDNMVKVTTDNLNLRTAPSIEDEIILTIPKGHKVEIIDNSNLWNKVKYNGQEGFVSSTYLTKDEKSVETEKPEESEQNKSPIIKLETPNNGKVSETLIEGILLVNKTYHLPSDYNPGEDPIARTSLDNMFKACKDEIDISLAMVSGFRSYDYQEGLFKRYSNKHGEDQANRFSARAGQSEHQTGLAFDIGGPDDSYWLKESFETTEEGIWLAENAHKFGYILRYPKGKEDITGYIYEPWHFRYVGIEHATKIYEEGLTLEEYLLD